MFLGKVKMPYLFGLNVAGKIWDNQIFLTDLVEGNKGHVTFLMIPYIFL